MQSSVSECQEPPIQFVPFPVVDWIIGLLIVSIFLTSARSTSPVMASMAPATLLRLDTPIRSLTLAFWLWKALLFVVIVACPGLGYDTSTSLINYKNADSLQTSPSEPLSRSLKFTRWDSIYFLHIAEHGHVFEQEWAFNYPRILGLFMSGKSSTCDHILVSS